MAFQFCEWYLSKSVVLSLLSLPCIHGNLTLKLYIYIRKSSFLNEEWHFIGRLKVGSLPRLTKKEVLAEFLYKST